MALSHLQDYIRIARLTRRDAFEMRIGGPVLIGHQPMGSSRFGSSSTRIRETPSQGIPIPTVSRLSHQTPVEQFPAERWRARRKARIGRQADNEVILLDDSVSWVHAEVWQDDETGGYLVMDLGSANGTLVNGAPALAGAPTRLVDGTAIQFGDAAFRFYSPGGLYDALKPLCGN